MRLATRAIVSSASLIALGSSFSVMSMSRLEFVLITAHPFPFPLVALGDDHRMMDADIAVECDRRADAVFVEHVHEAEDADTVAVSRTAELGMSGILPVA